MRTKAIEITIGRVPLAVILNLTSFGLATLSLVGLLVAVTMLYRPPTRPCHRCGARVPLGMRVCRDCGYDFEPVRFSR
jgi:ribosomal protein L40E